VNFDSGIIVSGVSTFSSDINTLNINASGTLTSGIINSDEITTNSLDVERFSVSYTGTLIGVSTNIISNTDTTGILINYLVSGTNIPQETVVSSIGSSSIILSKNTTNNFIPIQRTGSFESASGNVITGISTSNIQVGFGVTGNSYVSAGTTIANIGISSVILSQNASNPYGKELKEGTLSGVSTNIISGIDTSGIFIGQIVSGNFISIGSTVLEIGIGNLTLSQSATNISSNTSNYEFYFVDIFSFIPLEAISSSIYTYTDINSGNLVSYSIDSTLLESNEGSIGILTGTTLSYDTAVFGEYQATTGIVTSLIAEDLTSNVGIVSNISGNNLNYTGIGTISTLNVSTLNSNTVSLDFVDVINLSGQNLNISGVGSITTLNSTTLYSPSGEIDNLVAGIGTVTTLNVSNLFADSVGISTIVSTGYISGDDFVFSGIGTVDTLYSSDGNITTLNSTDIFADNVSIANSLSSQEITSDLLTTVDLIADTSTIGISGITTANISNLTVTESFVVSIGSSNVLFGQGTIVAAGGTINDISGNSITYLSGNISNLDSQFIDVTNKLTSAEGSIGFLTGTNLDYSGISTLAVIDSNKATIDYLNGINLNYSGISTLTNLETNEVTVNTSLSSPLIDIVNGTVDGLSGINLYYQTGIVTSLSGSNISYSGLGTITNLLGTNINYSGIGTIDSLYGTTISYSGDSSFGNITVTDGINAGGNLTAFAATFTNEVDAFSIATEEGIINTLSGNNLSYNSGIITSLSGTNISYSGVGTILTLQGTNISYTGVGTFGQVGITTATIGTISATNVSIFGNLSVSDLTVGIVTANDVITDNITSTEGTITNLDGLNLSYSGIGTISKIESTTITTTNLGTQNLNASGIGTIATLKTTNLDNLESITTDEFYARIGIITELSGNTIDYNTGSVDNLSGVNLNYSGIGTINQIDVNIGSVDYLNGVNANYTGISTFNVAGITSLTSQSIFGSAGIITSLTGETLNFSTSAEISNVTIGIGNTDLIVSGDARITDTLTIGPDSIIINGISNSITGVSTLTSNYASIGTITGSDSTYTNVNTDSLTFAGINTSNNFNTQVNIVASNSGVSTSYNLILPAQLGIPGTVLTLESDGNLGFTTAGLYENRIYVSPVNGDDSNDGKARPVKTIKKAAQLASFESFVLPGGRFLDAASVLSSNKDFIAAEVVGFVTTTYPSILSNPDYNEAICKRDVGYIVDAISYDLSYGGNSKTVEAGLAYWNAGTSYVDGESIETIAGYNHIITISKYIINNIDIPQSYQGIQTVFQTKDLTLAYDANCSPSSYSENCCSDVWSAIGSFVGIVTSIIGIGTTAAPSVTLPTSKSTPVAVIVEAGEYVEDNPIILYEDVAIIGDNLRNTIIRPQNAGKDLFRVRNGCYLTGFALKDYVDPAGVPQFTFNYAVAFDDPSDPTTSRVGYAIKETKPIITRSPYIQNCSILSFLGANGILVDGSKVDTLNTAIIPEESENPVEGEQPEFGKSMVAAAFTMVSFGGIGWRVINDGYSQVVSCFQIFCRYGSLAQSGGYLSITNSATNFGLYALRSTGYNGRSYIFDRGLVSSTGTSGGLQTLKVIGLGRADQELYVLRFINRSTGIDETSNFKLAPITREVDISVGVNTVTNIIGIQTHGFTNGDSVIYLGNESTIPPQVIGGLVNLNEYYVEYVNDDEFKLYEDDSLTRIVDLTSVTSGINTFVKGNQEFFNSEMLNSHTSYQRVSLASTTSILNFVPGRQITQTVNGGTAVGIAYTYNSTTRELIVSVEAPGGVRNNFGVSGVGVNGLIQDHNGSPISIGVTAVAGISTLHTVEFKVDSTQTGSQILGIGGLPENYKVHFHRPSIVNSSSHTWEFSGSGTDYNALPQNGGKTRVETEQVFSQGGRVYSSGTNELGDFKIGNFITAYNRTGNIIFNNKVSIGQLDSLRLSLSGGVAIEEFSTDIGLGDNEVGGALNSRVSTQKAVRTFLNNRLGNFIDKDLSTNAVPSAVVQLNAFGQINADLIPPKVVNYYTADVGGGRTTLVDRIPAVDLRQGDTVVEPDFSYVLISDVYSQYLILSDSNRNYDFNNGDEVVSAVSNGGAIGIVTAPTSVGYGTTGLVKGVLLNGSLTSGGSGYTSAGIYTGVTLTSTSGIGTGAKANITVGASGSVTDVDVVYGGRYYDENNTLTVTNPNDIGGRSGGSDFVFTVSNIETRLYIELTNNQKFTGSTLLNDYIEDGTSVGISTTLTNTYTLTFNPTSIETGGDIDFTNDRIVIGTNNFSDGDNVVYSAGGGNTLEELISGDTYYIKRVGISSVELYTTYALSTKKNFLSSGTGTHSITRKVVNTTENKLTFVNHGYSTGDAVRVSGNVPAGISTGDYYFVGSVTTNAFSLHDTQQTSLASVNGLIFNAVDITSVGSGTLTLTKQNVQYTSTVNTSSNILDNWTVLSSGTVDAANITTGTISPSRLGSGNANSDTFLGGDSVYRKAVKSVGIGTTTPMTITSSSFEVENGITKHFGDLQVSLNRVEETLETYSTTGIAKFKTSTFDIGDDGAVSIKSSQFGDVDAATLGGFTGAYYLDLNNSTGTVPIPRGGTGLSALPSEGYLLVGNGSAYTLTGNPTIAGTLTGEITIKSGGDIELPTGTWTGEKAAKIQNSSNNLYLQYTTNLIGRNSSGTDRLTLTSGGNLTVGGTVEGTRLISNIANGTAPLTVTSSTVVTNLNADAVDGIQGASLLRSDDNDEFSGTLTYTGSGTALNFTSTGEVILADHSSNSTPVPFDIRKSGSTLSDSESYGILHLSRLNHNNSATTAGASLYFQLRDSGGTLREYAGISGQKTEAGAAGGRLQFYRYGRTSLGYWDANNLYIGTNGVWHAGNDGAGSGLDADLFDGVDSSSFLRSDATDTVTGGSVLQFATSSGNIRGYLQSTDTDDAHFIIATSGGEDIAFKDGGVGGTTNMIIRGDGTLLQGTSNTIWHAGNDGPSSGLNADLLDDLQATSFLRSDTNTSTTGFLGAEGFVGTGGGALRLVLPHGASYATTASSVTGAIKVNLPQSWSDTMMRMTIKIYEYATGESFEVICGGYNYTGNSSWINTFAYILGDPQINRNFNVRFGHDGTRCCIYIGETNSTWSYPQVAVTEFEAGYSSYGEEAWNDNWSIEFATSLGTITSILSNREIGRWVDGNTVWHAGNDGAGSGLDADTLDGIQGASFIRSDENDSVSGVIDFLGGSSTTPAIRIRSGGNNWSEGLAIHPSSNNSYALAFFRTSSDLGTSTNTWAIGNLGENGTNNFGLIRNGLTGSAGIRADSIFDATQAGILRFGFTPTVGSNTMWHAGNDGSGSGLDADLLDGQQGTYYRQAWQNVDSGVRTDYTLGFQPPASGYAGFYFSKSTSGSTAQDAGYLLVRGTSDNDIYTAEGITLVADAGWLTLAQRTTSSRGVRIMSGTTSAERLRVNTDGTIQFVNGAGFTYNGNTIWHAGNDGSGTGLDADTVDGYHFLQTQGISAVGNFGQWQPHSTYTNFNASVSYWGWNYVQGNTNAPNNTSSQWYRNRVSLGSDYGLNYASGHYWLEMAYPRSDRNSAGHMWVRVCENGSVGSWEQVGSYINGNTTWHAGNDGPGSGLDADTLDTFTWDSSGKNLRGTEIYADNWFRNYNSGEGLYNEETAMHWYSDANWRWRLYSTTGSAAILFTTSGNNVRGYLYADTASSIGFLNTASDWGLRYLSNDGNSPNLYFLESGNENWSGNPGNDEGKIEYHSNRFYIASGANSTEIARFRQSGTDRVVIQNDGNITINSNTVWHAGNDGAGSTLDADTVDGYQGSELANNTHIPTSEVSNIAVGWYTIAVNAGDRAVARFGIRDTQSGRHQSVIFYASHKFGNFSELTVLHSSRYSGNPLRYIRIKEGGTYDGALLQVYVDDSGNSLQAYLLGDNFQSGGWVIKNWIPDATNPGGLNNFGALTNVAAQIDLDNILDGGMATTGEIFAGGDTTQYKVWHAGNHGSGSNLDADKLDGLDLHTGRNNEANKVVRTDGNGYIQAGWINSVSGNMGDWGNGVNKYYLSNDDYIRYIDRNSIKVQLGLTAKWDADRRDYTTDSNYFVGSMGWGTTDMNSVFDWGSGFIDSWSNPGNQPSGTSHWVGVQALHYTNGSARYGWQMVGGPIGNLRFRNTWPSFSSWRTIPVLDVNDINGGTMYAGSYSDANNTAYYVDPDSTSRIGAIQIGAASDSSNEIRFRGVSGDGPGAYDHAAIIERLWGAGDQSELLIFKGNDPDTGGIHDRIRIAATGRIVFDSYNGYGNVSDYIGARGTGNVDGSMYINGNSVFVSGDIRSPIFYDFNNTNFYIDPASTSVVNGIVSSDYIRIRGNKGIMGDYDTDGTASKVIWTIGASWPLGNMYGLGYEYGSGYDHHLALRNNGTTYSRFGFAGGMYLTGTGTASSDWRAPIFYDSNDTAYYLDPTSTSDQALRIRGGVLHGGNPTWGAYLLVGGDGRQNRTNDANVASVCTTNGNLHIDAASGYDTYINFYDGNNVYFGNGANGTVAQIASDGTFRSPVFYDYNDTGYYINPASDGTRAGYLNGNLWINPKSESYGEGITFYMPSQNTWGGIRWYRNGSPFTGNWAFGYFGNEASNDIGFHNGTNGWRLDHSFNMTSNGSVRSPIFYDSNNTGYYVDPASNTTLYGQFQVSGGHGDSQIGVRLLSGNNGAGTGEVNLRMWCSEPGITWDWAGFGYNVTNNNGSPSGFGRLNTGLGQAYFRFSTAGNMYVYNTNTSGTRYSTMEWYSDGTCYANNYLTGGSSLRAPIFYDSNDTGYYADPNSTSRFNGITPNVINSPYNGGNSGLSRSSYPYSFGFQETGGWSYPYPDLVLHYHTGVTFAANASYDGMTFKADYNDDTVIFRVNGGSNYLYKYYWMYTNTTGFYSDTNGAHLYPNTGSSYGTWRIDGSRNGYAGFWFNNGGGVAEMFDSSGNGGWYREASGLWYVYYNIGNTCLGVDSSTTSSSYALYVSGAIYSTSNIVSASDARLKDNVNTIENALDKVLNLRGVTFTWNNRKEDDPDYQKTQIGFIAQEVEEVVPEVVTYAEDIDEYSLNYGQMTALLTEAMKQQQEMINNMKKEIEELKKKLGE
jgi:hypothetical protein